MSDQPEKGQPMSALDKYGSHLDDCMVYEGERVCTCGFDDALLEQIRCKQNIRRIALSEVFHANGDCRRTYDADSLTAQPPEVQPQVCANCSKPKAKHFGESLWCQTEYQWADPSMRFRPAAPAAPRDALRAEVGAIASKAVLDRLTTSTDSAAPAAPRREFTSAEMVSAGALPVGGYPAPIRSAAPDSPPAGPRSRKTDDVDRYTAPDSAPPAESEPDTSDIPEITDWSKAERGKFYRPPAQPTSARWLDQNREIAGRDVRIAHLEHELKEAAHRTAALEQEHRKRIALMIDSVGGDSVGMFNDGATFDALLLELRDTIQSLERRAAEQRNTLLVGLLRDGILPVMQAVLNLCRRLPAIPEIPKEDVRAGIESVEEIVRRIEEAIKP